MTAVHYRVCWTRGFCFSFLLLFSFFLFSGVDSYRTSEGVEWCRKVADSLSFQGAGPGGDRLFGQSCFLVHFRDAREDIPLIPKGKNLCHLSVHELDKYVQTAVVG